MSTTIHEVSKAEPRTARLSQSVSRYYLELLQRLGFGGSDFQDHMRCLGVTSCYRKEGTSTVAAQLATAAASMFGLRVVLIDCNLAHPAVHRTFGVSLGPGLENVLRSPARLREYIQNSPVDNLSLLTAGEFQDDAWGAYASPHWAGVMGQLREDYELVVADVPASEQKGAIASVGCLTDGMVLVVEAERVRWEVAQRTTHSLKRSGVDVVGVVMNKRPEHVPNWVYKRL